MSVMITIPLIIFEAPFTLRNSRLELGTIHMINIIFLVHQIILRDTAAETLDIDIAIGINVHIDAAGTRAQINFHLTAGSGLAGKAGVTPDQAASVINVVLIGIILAANKLLCLTELIPIVTIVVSGFRFSCVAVKFYVLIKGTTSIPSALCLTNNLQRIFRVAVLGVECLNIQLIGAQDGIVVK